MNIRPQNLLSHEPTLWFRRHQPKSWKSIVFLNKVQQTLLKVCFFCNVNVSTTSFLALTFLGFVHVNLMNFFFWCSDNSTVLSGCFFPLCLLWVFEDIGHMTPNNYFPVRLRFILRSAKIVAAPFCTPSHPILLTFFGFRFCGFSPLISRKKKSHQSWLKFVPGHGSAVWNFFVRKSSTFCQLPTNQPLVYSQSHLGWHFRMLFQKLKAQSSNVSFHSNAAKETFELWVLNFRTCHPKWDWL